MVSENLASSSLASGLRDRSARTTLHFLERRSSANARLMPKYLSVLVRNYKKFSLPLPAPVMMQVLPATEKGVDCPGMALRGDSVATDSQFQESEQVLQSNR